MSWLEDLQAAVGSVEWRNLRKRSVKVTLISGPLLFALLALPIPEVDKPVAYIIWDYLFPTPYVILVIGPQTSEDYGTTWTSFLDGVQIAEPNLPQNGKKALEIEYQDTGGNPEIALDRVLKAIDNDKVLAVVGPMTSSAAALLIPKIAESDLPLILPMATNPELLKEPENGSAASNIFRLVGNDDQQVKTLAQEIKKASKDLHGRNGKKPKLAILREPGNERYRRPLARKLAAEVRDCRPDEICPEVVVDAEISGINIPEKLLAVEMIFFAGGQPGAAFLNFLIPDQGPEPILFMADASLASTEGWTDKLPKNTTATFSNGCSGDSALPEGKRSHCEKPKNPNFVAIGYDAINLIREARESSRGLSRVALKERLHDRNNWFRGVASDYEFLPSGENEKAEFHVFRIHLGRWKHCECACQTDIENTRTSATCAAQAAEE